jgi:CMP-N-acetylneuraminic acid synthetase
MAFEDGCFGKQIFKHDLYRRQDYPKVFEISHYICIFKVSELKNLNKNLYNEETHFYKLEKKIDVDRKEDLENYERIYKNNS